MSSFGERFSNFRQNTSDRISNARDSFSTARSNLSNRAAAVGVAATATATKAVSGLMTFMYLLISIAIVGGLIWLVLYMTGYFDTKDKEGFKVYKTYNFVEEKKM